jgi:hypothetical protein
MIGHMHDAPGGFVGLPEEETPRPSAPIHVEPAVLPREDLPPLYGVAAAHDANTILASLLQRLDDEGRDAKAGNVILGWLHGVAGPTVDPRAHGRALVEALRRPPTVPAHLAGKIRVDAYPDLADAIASLLEGSRVERDPAELVRIWQDEVSRSIFTARPLAAALVHALRLAGHAEHPWLADAVLELLQEARPPILDARARGAFPPEPR